eukprot:COSAG02_NODE_305_length_25176_cov_30.787455_14_plen_116_part_00
MLLLLMLLLPLPLVLLLLLLLLLLGGGGGPSASPRSPRDAAPLHSSNGGTAGTPLQHSYSTTLCTCATLEIGDVLRSGFYSQMTGATHLTVQPRSQNVPDLKSRGGVPTTKKLGF